MAALARGRSATERIIPAMDATGATTAQRAARRPLVCRPNVAGADFALVDLGEFVLHCRPGVIHPRTAFKRSQRERAKWPAVPRACWQLITRDLASGEGSPSRTTAFHCNPLSVSDGERARLDCTTASPMIWLSLGRGRNVRRQVPLILWTVRGPHAECAGHACDITSLGLRPSTSCYQSLVGGSRLRRHPSGQIMGRATSYAGNTAHTRPVRLGDDFCECPSTFTKLW